MGGLSFLSKKSWHTSTLKNQEKVWIAEQAASNEQKRIAELQKQVAEERQILELQQLQEASGRGREGPARVDWMYEGPVSSANAERDADAYLLGKEYKPADSGVNELKALETAPGAMLAAAASTDGPSKPHSANEAFRRLHEDPLLMMRRAERDAKTAVVSNPVRMGRIQAELEREMREKRALKDAKREAKRARKQERKDAKRARKDKKKKRARSDDGASSSSGSESDGGGGGGGGARNGGGSSSKHKRRRSSEERGEGARLLPPPPPAAVARESSAASGGRRHRRSASPPPARQQQHESGRRCDESREARANGEDGRNGSGSGGVSARDGRYGLLGADGGRREPGALGPEPHLLERRRREEAEESAKKAAARRRAAPLSHEEKLRRLAEMERDAGTHQQLLRERIEEGRRGAAASTDRGGGEKGERDGAEGANGDRERDSRESRAGSRERRDGRPAGFIREVNAAAYEGQGLADRVQRGRHFHQRAADSDNFMAR